MASQVNQNQSSKNKEIKKSYKSYKNHMAKKEKKKVSKTWFWLFSKLFMFVFSFILFFSIFHSIQWICSFSVRISFWIDFLNTSNLHFLQYYCRNSILVFLKMFTHFNGFLLFSVLFLFCFLCSSERYHLFIAFIAFIAFNSIMVPHLSPA